MKVFLCGGGSGETAIQTTIEFGKTVDKTKPLLYIPLAMEKERYDSCLEWITKEMKSINLNNIEMIKDAKEIKDKNLNDYCAIFIGGGNTYKLLKEIKEAKVFDKIKEYIYSDSGVVYGGSAGAIIFGKDINSCKMQDPNNVNLIDTKGFNIVNDYCILCHLNRNDGIKFNRDKNSEYLLKYSKDEKIIYIPDDDTIVVDKNGISMIGNSDFRIYKEGKFNAFNCLNEKII